MKIFVFIITIIITIQVVKCGLVVTNPLSSYKPLPEEIIDVTWESEYSFPVNLFYRTDIEKDWILISENNIDKKYSFQCPSYFFDYIEFKVVQNVPLPPKLIWEQTCEHSGDVTYGVFSPNSKSVAICSSDGYIEAYSNQTQARFYQSSQYDNNHYHIGFIDTSDILHSGLNPITDSSNIQTTNINTALTNNYINYLFKNDQGIDVDYCAKTNNIISALIKSSILLIINKDTKKSIIYQTTDSTDIYSVCFSANGDRIYIGDYSGYITVLDTALNLIKKFSAHGNGGFNPIWGIDCSDDGKLLGSCGVDGYVKVWNTETFDLVNKFKHNFHVRDVAFEPSSANIMSASLDSTIREWNIASGIENFSLDYKAQALSANYSITGDTIIGTGRDNRFMVWEKQKPLVLMDSVKSYSDNIAEIYIPDIQSKPGVTVEVPLLIKVNPRFPKQGVNIKFTSSVSFPNRLLDIYEYHYAKKGLYDKVSWDLFKEIKNSQLDHKYGLTLLGDVSSDSIKLSKTKILEPLGAKFYFHGGLLTILNQCTESSFRLVNISDSNNTIFINNNIGSFDIIINDHASELKDLSIYNIVGCTIPEKDYLLSLKKNRVSVDISKFASGIYFVVLHNNESYIVKKIVVQK